MSTNTWHKITLNVNFLHAFSQSNPTIIFLFVPCRFPKKTPHRQYPSSYEKVCLSLNRKNHLGVHFTCNDGLVIVSDVENDGDGSPYIQLDDLLHSMGGLTISEETLWIDSRIQCTYERKRLILSFTAVSAEDHCRRLAYEALLSENTMKLGKVMVNAPSAETTELISTAPPSTYVDYTGVRYCFHPCLQTAKKANGHLPRHQKQHVPVPMSGIAFASTVLSLCVLPKTLLLCENPPKMAISLQGSGGSIAFVVTGSTGIISSVTSGILEDKYTKTISFEKRKYCDTGHQVQIIFGPAIGHGISPDQMIRQLPAHMKNFLTIPVTH